MVYSLFNKFYKLEIINDMHYKCLNINIEYDDYSISTIVELESIDDKEVKCLYEFIFNSPWYHEYKYNNINIELKDYKQENKKLNERIKRLEERNAYLEKKMNE